MSYVNGTCLYGHKIRETEKAFLFEFNTKKFVVQKWIPKSISTTLFEKGVIQIIKLPVWFILKDTDFEDSVICQNKADELIHKYGKKRA